MSFTNWLKSFFSHRGKTLALYRRGMAKANKRDYDGAIADYSAAIAEPHIPADVKAMAIYNRALAYSAIDEDDSAAEDLEALLEMPGLPENIRTAAQQRRERVRRRSEDTERK
jgi:tetratricopeptide (TPR) repeat protein